MLRQIIATCCVAVLFAGPAFADEATVTIKKGSSDGTGDAIGTVILKDGHHGLKVTPDLRDLPDITAGTDGRSSKSWCAVMGPSTQENEGRRAAICLWRHPELGAREAIPRAAAERLM